MANVKIQLIKGFGTAYHHPVVTKKQSAHGRHGADEIQKTFAISLHIFKRFCLLDAKVQCLFHSTHGQNNVIKWIILWNDDITNIVQTG